MSYSDFLTLLCSSPLMHFRMIFKYLICPVLCCRYYCRSSQVVVRLLVINKVEIRMEVVVSATTHSTEGSYAKLLAWDAPT